MNNSAVEMLENQKAGYLEAIKRRDEARKLTSNRIFKSLVLQEWCVDECARYAQMSADPNLGPNERADALAVAQAAGHFRRWLQVIEQMGAHADKELLAIDDAIVEARNAEDNPSFDPAQDYDPDGLEELGGE